MTTGGTFPSPCGEKIGKNEELLNVTGEPVPIVSVPLRGKDRKKTHKLKEITMYLNRVSVPLRGKDRKKTRPVLETHLQPCLPTRFPSPCGEKIGKNGDEPVPGAAIRGFVSVPLRGKDRKKTVSSTLSRYFFNFVSVPLRGKDRKKQLVL